MHKMGWTVIALAVCVPGALLGQTTPTHPAGGQGTAGAAQPPAAVSPEQQKVLTDVLTTWEADAKALQSLYVTFEEFHVDAVFKKQSRYYGEAKILKMPTGQYGLRLEMYQTGVDGKPDYSKLHRKYICSGNWFYQFDPASKLIFFHRLENQSVKPDDGPFAFIFGISALSAQRRFDLTIAQQDKDWTWIKVLPRTEQDLRDFEIALLGLVNYANQISPKYFPVQIKWREKGSKDERTWTFKQVVRNDLSKVGPMDFTIEEDKKRGWTLKEVPPQGSMSRPPATNPVTPAGAVVPRK